MNEHEYRQTVVKYKNLVYSQAYYFTGSREDAEDITQEVFIRLWHHRNSLKELSYKAWIMKVMRNLCIDYSRKKKNRPVSVSGEEEDVNITELIPDSSPNTEQKIEKDELVKHLQYCLKQLPEKMKSAVIMRDIQDETYDTIAEIMEIPLHSVKGYIHRGRKLLMKYFLNHTKNQLQGEL